MDERAVTAQEYLEARENGDVDVISRAAAYGVTKEDYAEDNATVAETTESSYTNSTEQHFEEPVAEDTQEEKPSEQDLIKNLVEEERRLRAEESERANTLEAEKRELQILLDQAKQRPVEQVVAEPIVDVNEADYETEFDYIKASIAELKKAVKPQSGSGTQVEEVLSKLDAMEEQNEAEAAKREQQKKKNELKNEFEEFWAKHPDLKPSQDFSIVENEFVKFRKALANTGLNQDGVDKVMAQLADPIGTEEAQGYLKAKGIELMPDFDKLWETLRIFDFRIGLKIDPATGNKVEIKDSLGNSQYLSSMEDAYSLMDKTNVSAKQQIEIWKALNGKLNERKVAATETPSNKTIKLGGSGMNEVDVRSILSTVRKNPRILKTNPEIAAKYNAIMSSI